MLRSDGWQAQISGTSPLPPMRHTLPTVPCDLSEYARAATGPLSWSELYDEEPRVRELDEPFDIEAWASAE